MTILLWTVVLAGTADAGTLATERARPWTLSLSASELTRNTGELTVERMLSEHSSVAAFAGAGSPRYYQIGVQGGGQYRRYVVGEPGRLAGHVGGELGLGMGLPIVSPAYPIESWIYKVSLGPIIGGKWVAESGFTLDGCVGVAANASWGYVNPDTGEHAFVVLPAGLTSVGIGWTF